MCMCLHICSVTTSATRLGGSQPLLPPAWVALYLSFSLSLSFPLQFSLYVSPHIALSTALSLSISLHLPISPSSTLSLSLRSHTHRALLHQGHGRIRCSQEAMTDSKGSGDPPPSQASIVKAAHTALTDQPQTPAQPPSHNTIVAQTSLA